MSKKSGIFKPPLRNQLKCRICFHQRWSREHKARGQGHKKNSRPRTQKKFEAKDSLSEDRHSRGQGQECSRPRTEDTSASALQKKRSSQKFFRQSPKKKKVFTKIFQALHKILKIQKIVLSSSRGQANFQGLEASRPSFHSNSPPLVSIQIFLQYITCDRVYTRGGVEDTRLEAKAKAKDTKKIRGQGQGQGQPFRGQTLSRPRTGMLEAKAKDQGHKRKCSPKTKTKKRSSQKFFRRSPKKKKRSSQKFFKRSPQKNVF